MIVSSEVAEAGKIICEGMKKDRSLYFQCVSCVKRAIREGEGKVADDLALLIVRRLFMEG